MNGFASPNYTQTPNDLFDTLLPEMGLAELKVVLCIIRNTFGFHRDETELSLRKIARATGLTANSVMEGAKQAEDHGLIERYQDGNKTTKWRAKVSVVPTDTPRRTSRDAGVVPTDTLLGVKERLNKDSKKGDLLDLSLEVMAVEERQTKAYIAFEEALKFGKLPWRSNSEWTRFARWVEAEYAKDPAVFKKFADWRTEKGKYDAMRNNAIRNSPSKFMDTGFPTFLAHSVMYGGNPEPKRRPLPEFINGRRVKA